MNDLMPTAEQRLPDTLETVLVTGPSLRFHADHDRLFNELHTRPFPVLPTPARVSNFALLHEGLSAQEERQHILSLCARHSINPPAPGASCYYQDFGAFEFRWERHAEFSTYTFLTSADGSNPFQQTALHRVAAEWLASLPRPIMSGIHIEVRAAEQMPEHREALRQLFEGHRLLCSQVIDRQAQLWTAYRIHSDGFLRFVIANRTLNPCQTGRVVRTVLELETYRMMLLLGLPQAKRITPELRRMEESLAVMTQQIKSIEDLDDERQLLSQLSELAARNEQLITTSSYRFNASQAYHALIQGRLEELREDEESGLLTIGEFLRRRMSPAFRTGESVRENLIELAQRIDRASELLRTRVNLQIEAQNQQLLKSMDSRSYRQLRLQQAVEGLSIAAITYYAVGLIKLLLDAGHAAGLDLHKDIVLGLAVPLVLLLSWGAVRSLKRSLAEREDH